MTTKEKVKHTPGPWELEYDGGDYTGAFTLRMATAIRDPGMHTAIHAIELYEGVWPDDPEFKEAEANALLIAAAPELLSALKALRDWIPTIDQCCESDRDELRVLRQNAADAIAKAEAQ